MHNTVAVSNVPVALSITNPAGATGVATFAGCKIDKVGTYPLSATSTGLASAVSSSTAHHRGRGHQARFHHLAVRQHRPQHFAFATQPVVAIQDAGGNTRTASSASVSLTITTPAGATLTCTTNPRSTTSGVATFAGCKINTVGTYTLTATTAGLTAAISAVFTIT